MEQLRPRGGRTPKTKVSHQVKMGFFIFIFFFPEKQLRDSVNPNEVVKWWKSSWGGGGVGVNIYIRHCTK